MRLGKIVRDIEHQIEKDIPLHEGYLKYLQQAAKYNYFLAGGLRGLIISAGTFLTLLTAPIFAKDLYVRGKVNGAFTSEGNTFVINYSQESVAKKDSASTSTDGDYLVRIPDGAADDPISRIDFSQNYPNPFNTNTKIDFNLSTAALVNLTAYNVLGEEVTTVLDRQFPAGNHTVAFNLDNLAGHPLADGVYIFLAQAGNHRKIIKSLLLRDAFSVNASGVSIESNVLQNTPATLTGFSVYGPELARSSIDLNLKPTSDQHDLGAYKVNPAKTSTKIKVDARDASGKPLEATLEIRVNRAGIKKSITSVASNGVSEFVDHVNLDQEYPQNAAMSVEDIELTSQNGQITFPLNQQVTSPTVKFDLQAPWSMTAINYLVQFDGNINADLELFGRAGANPFRLVGNAAKGQATLVYTPNALGIYTLNDVVLIDSLRASGSNGQITFPLNQQVNSNNYNLNLQTPLPMSQINFAVQLSQPSADLELFGRAGANPFRLAGIATNGRATLVYMPNASGTYKLGDAMIVDSLRVSGDAVFGKTFPLSRQVTSTNADLGLFELVQAAIVSGIIHNTYDYPVVNPFSAARIRLSSGQENFETVSDGQGKYSLRVAADVIYDVTIVHPDADTSNTRRRVVGDTLMNFDIFAANEKNGMKFLDEEDRAVYSQLFGPGANDDRFDRTNGWAKCPLIVFNWDTTTAVGKKRYDLQLALLDTTKMITTGWMHPNSILENASVEVRAAPPEYGTPGYWDIDFSDDLPEGYQAGTWALFNRQTEEMYYARTRYRAGISDKDLVWATQHENTTALFKLARLLPGQFNNRESLWTIRPRWYDRNGNAKDRLMLIRAASRVPGNMLPDTDNGGFPPALGKALPKELSLSVHYSPSPDSNLPEINKTYDIDRSELSGVFK